MNDAAIPTSGTGDTNDTTNETTTKPPTSGAPPASNAKPKSVKVVLYGTPDLDDGKRLRLQPIACALDGVLEASLRCGELMPAKTRVRLATGAVIAVSRSTKDFTDTAGGEVFKAPRGPACCMYNTCVGETIPYYAARAPANKLVAVWPHDANIDLALHRADAGQRAPGPPKLVVDQLVRVGNRALASGRDERRPCLSCAQLFYFEKDWQPVGRAGGPVGPDGYQVIATMDLDGDKRSEAVVYEQWRNDYGLSVLGNDWSNVMYRFSCGNI